MVRLVVMDHQDHQEVQEHQGLQEQVVLQDLVEVPEHQDYKVIMQDLDIILVLL